MGNDNGERIMPTRAGWWWYQLRDEDDNVLDAEVEWVNLDRRGVFMIQVFPPRPVTSSEIVMLAPIPSPETCAALARYAEALDDLDALWDGADFITRNNVTNRAYDAGDALDAAITAERDGAA